MGVNLQNIEPLTATSKINHSLIKTMHPPSPYTRWGQILTSVSRRPGWIQQYPRSIKQLEEMFSNQIVVIFFPMARYAVSFQMQDVFNINILLTIKVKKKNPVSQYIHIVQFKKMSMSACDL